MQLRLGICPIEVEVDRGQERNEAKAWEVLGLSIKFVLLLLFVCVFFVLYLQLGDRVNFFGVQVGWELEILLFEVIFGLLDVVGIVQKLYLNP